MPESSRAPSEREQQVNKVLAAYLEARRAGPAPDREELLRQHPELADQLRAFFADEDRFERLAEPIRPAAPAGAATVAEAPGRVGTGTDPVAGEHIRYFGDFEILGEIGRGGMGVVYRARQLSLNRLVALKMILSGHLATPEEVARFLREARAAARLDHPGIVPIHEVGESQGQHYFAMKLIEGGSLADDLAHFRRNPRAAAHLLARVARAVDHAHQAGILHRDLKPGNILLDARKQPHVTDFGLARRLDDDSHATRPGAIVGTASYMSPEQAAAHSHLLSPAADVFSLGAVLYELLTGRPPFRGETSLDTLRQVLEREPERPRRLDPGISRDLETICLKCLDKRPYRRYASAAALADDLEAWGEGRPIRARPVSLPERALLWCRRQPVLAGLTATAAALAVAAAVAGALGYRASATADRFAEEADRIAGEAREAKETIGQEIDRRTDAEASRDYANDMRKAAQLAEAEDVSGLFGVLEPWRPGPGRPDRRQWEWFYLHALGRRLSRPAPPPGKAPPPNDYFTLLGYQKAIVRLEWSPDGGKLLSYDEAGTVKAWDVAARRELFAFQVPKHWLPYRCDRWSPDGRRLAVVGAGGLVQVLDGATGESVAEIPGYEGHLVRDQNDRVGYRTPAWSPDGKELAVNGPDPEVRVFDAATGKLARSFAGHEAAVLDVAWAPDGKRLASGGADGTARVWEVASGKGLARYAIPDKAERPGTRVVAALVSWRPGSSHLLVSAATIDEARGYFNGYLKGRLWDVAGGKEVASLPYGSRFHPYPDSLRWGPDGKYLQNGSALYDVTTDRQIHQGVGGENSWPYRSFSADPGLRQAAVISESGLKVTLVGLPSGEAFHSLSPWLSATHNNFPGKEGTSAVGWRPDGWAMALGSSLGKVHVLDVPRPGEAVPSAYLDLVSDLIWAPAGGRFLVNPKSWGARLGSLPLRQPFTRFFGAGAASTLPKHLRLSPDGTRLAVSYSDNTLKVWDTTSAQLLARLPGHQKFGITSPPTVDGLGWSPRGKYLATWASDGTLKFWETASGREVLHFDGGGQFQGWGPTEDVAVQHWDGLHFWDLARGEKVRTVTGANGSSLAWSPDRKLVAGVELKQAGQGPLVVWNSDLSERVKEVHPQVGYSFVLAWSPDSRQLACVTSHDGGFLYDLTTGEKVTLKFETHSTLPAGIAWRPDGKQLAFAFSPAVYLFDARGVPQRTISETVGGNLAWGEQGLLTARLARQGGDTSQYERAVHIRNLTGDRVVKLEGEKAEEPFQLEGHDIQARRTLAWSPDGTQVAISGTGGTRVFDGISSKPLYSLKDAFGTPAWSPDGRQLAVLSEPGGQTKIQLWEVAGEKKVHEVTLPGASGYPHLIYLAWSPDGRHLALSQQHRHDSPSAIRVLDTQTWKEVRAFQGSATWQVLAWSPDGKLLAAGGDPVYLWDVGSGKEVHRLAGNLPQVDELLWVGMRLVVRSRQTQGYPEGQPACAVKVWDTDRGQGVIAVRGLAAELTFNRDLTGLARRSGDGSSNALVVWDVAAAAIGDPGRPSR